tara:strand:+ start:2519 stop:2707 length:189 start_codon:yes stop_codon:yes gene_type:complete
MKVKANKGYFDLKDSDNFIALGSTSTHLKLIAGEEVEINKAHLPLSKKIKDCLVESKSKGVK